MAYLGNANGAELIVCACDGLAQVAAAMMIATETMIGRNTTADAAITSTALICVRPIFGLARRVDTART